MRITSVVGRARDCLAVAVFLVWLATPTSADAYPVAHSLPLAELAEQADLVCKAEVIASKPIANAWFEKAPGFEAFETELRIVSVYKGKTTHKEIRFQHYGPSAKETAFHYMPQFYRFEAGRTYIVFAKATDADRVYRQLWKNHRSQEDQGVLLAAGKDMFEGPLPEVFWRELTTLLKSDKQADVVYALSHLDALSGGDYEKLKDLDRKAVLDVVRSLLKHRDPEIVRPAIAMVGSHNPYLSADYAAGWLATVGKGDIPGFSQWYKDFENLGGKLHWKDLAAVANSESPVELRALAIRALGRVCDPEILPLAHRWVEDPAPLVRQAAAVILADFPGAESQGKVKALAADPLPAVRLGAAQAIGFGQYKELVPELGKLIDDADSKVASVAALSLLSFALDDNRAVLAAHLKHKQFRALFVNALAREKPAEYVSDLCDVIRNKSEPQDWWGGRIPWGVSWDLLFRHAQQQPPARLKSGELDKVLDALEFPASGMADGPRYYSSSEPRDLYALYVQRGLTERAQKFRATCKKALSFDIDYFFKMVDRDPGQYERGQ